MNRASHEYLAIEVWDDKYELINHTTFWTGPKDQETVRVEVEFPVNREIIGLYADTSKENAIQNLGFVTWRPNPDAEAVPVQDFYKNRFRKTAMWGYTDQVSKLPAYHELWKPYKIYQWPLECDFQNMNREELENLQLQSMVGWASEGDNWTIQGFTTTLSNGASDFGDFFGGEKIELNLLGGQKEDAAKITEAACELPVNKKIARVRIHEKDLCIPGDYAIQAIEFIDD